MRRLKWSPDPAKYLKPYINMNIQDQVDFTAIHMCRPLSDGSLSPRAEARI